MKRKDHGFVLIAVVIQQLIGMIWYSSEVMGPRWMQAQGKTMDQVHSEDPTPFMISIIASFVFAYFMRWLFLKLDITNWAAGARTGTYLALCVSVSFLATHYAFLGHSLDLVWIDSGHVIMSGFLSGIVLSKR
jgi:hypothetical protein